MEKTNSPLPILRALVTGNEPRSLLLATLNEAVELWRQTGSLAAYVVVFSALDSNDDEVRKLAEQSLSRSSPRPTNHRTNSGSTTPLGPLQPKESA